MKTCRHCGEQKHKSEFPVHREKGGGLSSWCRACHAEACANWRAEHPEKVDAYNARRRAEYAARQEAEHQAARKGAEREAPRAGSPEPRTRRAATGAAQEVGRLARYCPFSPALESDQRVTRLLSRR
jgi:hypothetical protein